VDEVNNTYLVEGPYELVLVENRTFNYLVDYRVWKGNQCGTWCCGSYPSVPSEYEEYDNAKGKRVVWQKNEHNMDTEQHHCGLEHVLWRARAMCVFVYMNFSRYEWREKGISLTFNREKLVEINTSINT
jgi:hypothetical protein